MKLLLSADIHADLWKSYSDMEEGGLTSRFRDQLDLLNQMLWTAKQEDCKAFVFCGDLFHKFDKTPYLVYHEIISQLRKMARVAPVYLVVGNHDFITKGGARHLLETMSGGNIHVLHGAGTFLIEGLTMGYHSYSHTLQTVEADVLFAHLGVTGAALHNNYTYRDNIDIQPLLAYRLACLGHIHIHQYLAPSVLYLGSPQHHTFSDANKDTYGYWVVDIGETITKQMVKPLYMPEFKAVDLTAVVGATEEALLALLQDNIVKVRLGVDELKRWPQVLKELLEYEPISLEYEVLRKEHEIIPPVEDKGFKPTLIEYLDSIGEPEERLEEVEGLLEG